MTRADEGVGPYRMALVGADLCVRPLPGHHHIRVGADAHIRPFPGPIYYQAERKRIWKDSPFDTHPEVSTRPTIAAQDP